jgi:surface carbohydrate biosynthesis protein
VKFSSVHKALAYLWHSKKIWRKPEKAKVLIFDRAGSEELLTYLDQKSVELLDLRGESLNLYVLFKCLLHCKLSLINYIVQYLKCVEPRVALTFIDNNPLFYQLKSHQKDLTTVFVQNGLRAEAGCVLGILKKQTYVRNKYQVDYMLTFGNAIGQKYSKYIDGKVHPIGSFKNNLHQSETQKQFKTVLFISQYRSPPSPESIPMMTYDNQSIFWKQFYSAEEFLLPLLQQYCQQNKLELKICMCSAEQKKEERNYFISLLGNENLELLNRSNPYSSYEKVDAAEFVVFMESTLGYEALARGKKTAAFPLRGKLLGAVDRKFGWPADLPDNGPFWTNHADECEFKRVMDYITTVSDEAWEKTRQRYVPELMEYDPGNTRFLKLMREIGVPLKRKYQNKEN